MTGAVWHGYPANGPREAPQSAVPFDRAEADDGVLRDDLHAYLSYADAKPAERPPAVPRTHTVPLHLNGAAPWVHNPPGARAARTGNGAEYIASRRSRDQLDALHADLGEFIDAPQPAQQPAVPAEGMVGIEEVAKAVGLTVVGLRSQIRAGAIPDAPARGEGKRRASPLGKGLMITSAKKLWPAAEVAQMRVIAREEGQLNTPKRLRSLTNYSQRMHELAEQRTASR